MDASVAELFIYSICAYCLFRDPLNLHSLAIGLTKIPIYTHNTIIIIDYSLVDLTSRTHTHTYTYTYANIHTCTCMYIRVHTCTRMYSLPSG